VLRAGAECYVLRAGARVSRAMTAGRGSVKKSVTLKYRPVLTPVKTSGPQ